MNKKHTINCLNCYAIMFIFKGDTLPLGDEYISSESVLHANGEQVQAFERIKCPECDQGYKFFSLDMLAEHPVQ